MRAEQSGSTQVASRLTCSQEVTTIEVREESCAHRGVDLVYALESLLTLLKDLLASRTEWSGRPSCVRCYLILIEESLTALKRLDGKPDLAHFLLCNRTAHPSVTSQFNHLRRKMQSVEQDGNIISGVGWDAAHSAHENTLCFLAIEQHSRPLAQYNSPAGNQRRIE